MAESGVRDVGGDLQVETPRGKTLVLGSPVYDDLRVEMQSVRVPSEAGPGFAQFLDNGSSSTGVFLYWFDATAVEQVYFGAQFPHSQRNNSGISPHVHWVPKQNGSAGQVVSWGLEYSWADIGGVFGQTNIVYANTHFPADSALVANKHYVTDFTDIKCGANVSNVLICRFFRDATAAGATDSYTADAGVLYFDFHFILDTLGSREEYSK